MGKLTINDQEIEGVDVKTVVHRSNGDVEIRTVGKEMLAVVGSEPGPEPESEPAPEPEPEPPSGEVVRGYHIRDLTDARDRVNVTSPAGHILASSFTVPDGITRAEFKFQNITQARVRVWISETPGGPPVTGYTTSSFTYTLPLVVGDKFKAGDRYHVNMQNADSDDMETAVTRHVTTKKPDSSDGGYDWGQWL